MKNHKESYWLVDSFQRKLISAGPLTVVSTDDVCPIDSPPVSRASAPSLVMSPCPDHGVPVPLRLKVRQSSSSASANETVKTALILRLPVMGNTSGFEFPVTSPCQ